MPAAGGVQRRGALGGAGAPQVRRARRRARPSRTAGHARIGTRCVRAKPCTPLLSATRLSASSLAAWNGLGDGTLIRVGQRLRLTPIPPDLSAARPAVPAVAASEAPPRWQGPVPGPVLARYGESPLTASGIQLGGRSGDADSGGGWWPGGLCRQRPEGYGELLIIKHSSQLAERLRVQPGAPGSRG